MQAFLRLGFLMRENSHYLASRHVAGQFVQETLMNARKSALVALTLAAATTAAFANERYHPSNSEVGVTIHPDHRVTPSDLSRAQVNAQVMGAQRDGTLTWISRGYPARYPLVSGPTLSKTRQQVEDELLLWKRNPVAPDGARDMGGELGWVGSPVGR